MNNKSTPYLLYSNLFLVIFFIFLVVYGTNINNNYLNPALLSTSTISLLLSIFNHKKLIGKFIIVFSVLAIIYSLLGWWASIIIN